MDLGSGARSRSRTWARLGFSLVRRGLGPVRTDRPGPKVFLDTIEPALGDALGRKDRPVMLVAVLSDGDVAPARVAEVLGEGAECAQAGIGVPAGPVLDMFPLHLALVKGFDGESGGH